MMIVESTSTTRRMSIKATLLVSNRRDASPSFPLTGTAALPTSNGAGQPDGPHSEGGYEHEQGSGEQYEQPYDDQFGGNYEYTDGVLSSCRSAYLMTVGLTG